MIVYKQWTVYSISHRPSIKCEGWFLFGFIPLYVRKIHI